MIKHIVETREVQTVDGQLLTFVVGTYEEFEYATAWELQNMTSEQLQAYKLNYDVWHARFEHYL